MFRYLVRLAVGVFITLQALSPSAHATDPQAGIDIDVVYRAVYPGLKRHKAIAVGPSGAWGYSYNHRSVAEAEKDALRTCVNYARRLSWGKNAKCQIFAKNDKLSWRKALIGISLDETLPLPDIPLKRAAQFWPKGTKLKGIVLALHGCNGPGSRIDSFADSWFRFFQARGFLVVYPSSFDEPRPAQFCGAHSPATYVAATEAVKFRAAQTKRTIAELKKAHPGIPLYVWAHSEGGLVAQVLDVKVSGIIIVGTVCGLSTPKGVLVPKSVPILHVYGSLDDKVSINHKTLSRKTVDKLCGPHYRSKTRSWVIATDADHLTSLWRQNVIDATSRMIGQKSFSLSEAKLALQLEGQARTVYENAYLKAGKTAFAIGPGGTYGIAAYWPNAEDMKQDALYQCARAVEFLSQNAPYPPGGKQPCRLYAVGNKVIAQRATEGHLRLLTKLPCGLEN
jgi:poly(3-hydroxybutyrate) depolymerase